MLLTAMKVLGTRVVFGKLNANIAIWEILGLENSVLPQEGFVMRDTFHKFSFIKWSFHACKRLKPVLPSQPTYGSYALVITLNEKWKILDVENSSLM